MLVARIHQPPIIRRVSTISVLSSADQGCSVGGTSAGLFDGVCLRDVVVDGTPSGRRRCLAALD
jgi:hypothetical protein